MKITLLGTGTPDPIADRFGPSTLVEVGSEKLLIDCGRGVPVRLAQSNIPMSAVTAVFLTHLHSDHVIGIPDLWLTGWIPLAFGRRATPFPVWGPAGTVDLMANLQKAFATDIQFRLTDGFPHGGEQVDARDIEPGVVYENGGVRVTAFLVEHGGAKPAFGYRIDYGKRSVVISGDTTPNENVIRYATGADVLIHEVAWVRPELLSKSPGAMNLLRPHTTPEQAGDVFASANPRLAVFSHVGLLTTDPAIPPPTVANVLKLTRKNYDGRVVMGEDLTTIEVGEKIKVRRARPSRPDKAKQEELELEDTEPDRE